MIKAKNVNYEKFPALSICQMLELENLLTLCQVLIWQMKERVIHRGCLLQRWSRSPCLLVEWHTVGSQTVSLPSLSNPFEMESPWKGFNCADGWAPEGMFEQLVLRSLTSATWTHLPAGWVSWIQRMGVDYSAPVVPQDSGRQTH